MTEFEQRGAQGDLGGQDHQDDLGALEFGRVGFAGNAISGPPWILGHRGTPLQAPENTLSSLQRAVALGLDGFEYDVRGCASGDLILLHDETLERTTNASGLLIDRNLPQLFGIDAGGWAGAQFAGEPLPVLSEALDIPGRLPEQWPQHMIELKEDGLVEELQRLLREYPHPLNVRVASFHLGACREARDAGLPAMYLAHDADEDLRQLMRHERFAAVGLKWNGWQTAAGGGTWPCEAWAWSVDEPEDILFACRRPLFGFNTNEPLRAMAVRALVRLAPQDNGAYPLQVPSLNVHPEAGLQASDGEWCGSWDLSVKVRNPFPFACHVQLGLLVGRGAFEVDGLPVRRHLDVGEEWSHPIRLTGGSWSPGADPRVVAQFVWEPGPGRPGEGLALDATLHRVRQLDLSAKAQADPNETRRLTLLRESPRDFPASMTVQRRGGLLIVTLENPGELEEASCVVRLDGVTHHGGRSLRLRLPARARQSVELEFSCGLEGRDTSGGRLRRWAGGIGAGPRSGHPGVLLL